MKTLKLSLVMLLLGICSSAQLSAEVRRLCKVYYETEEGWSSGYTMEVSFVTGTELNRATRSYDYSPFSNYCLVWFDRGEVVILRIESFLVRSNDEFERSDFKNLFLIHSDIECTQVNGPEERNWRIRARDVIQYVDPREN